MRTTQVLLLLATLCSVSVLQIQAQTPLVEIFYETLNDPVRRFFVEQYPAVQRNLLDQIDLRLYPYGNTVNEGTTYTCPYGDTQCEANKLHACLITAERLPTETGRKVRAADAAINQTSVSSFATCFFKNRYARDNVEDLGESCLPADGGADWAEIRLCVLETDNTVNEDYRDVTAGETIPADGLLVKIGGAVSEAAKTNLVGAVCAAIGSTTGICPQTTAPAKVKLAVYYEAFDLTVGTYLEKQLSTFYHVLEDFVDLELIPYGNTQLTGTDTYECAQGETQCISNKFQALVVDHYMNNAHNGDPISGQNRAVNFITCLYQSANSLSAIEACANNNLQPDDYRLYYDYIRLNTDEVKTVMATMRQKTADVAPTGLTKVPLVTLNGVTDYNALDDLVQEACAQYAGTQKAGICTKVNITLLYEPLNHKSRTLILEQLRPVFVNLYNLLNLQLVPAGRAIISPGHGFVCPGGQDQCNSMKLQACAIDFFWNDGNNYTDPTRVEVFDFLWCMTKNKRMLGYMDAADLCASQYLETDAWFTIGGCFLDGTAEALLADNIELTHSLIVDVEHQAIPILFINDVQVTDLNSLEAQVCAFYDDYHKPDYCFNEQPAKVKVQVYYESMSDLAKHFFTTQFEPWYIYLEEMLSVELLPAGNVLETANTDGTCDSYDANSTCMANKLQAVIIDRYFKSDDDGDYIDGTFRAMEFLKCVFAHANFKDSIYAAYEYCTGQVLIYDDWFDLYVTAKAPAGAATYKAVLDATAAFKAELGVTSLESIPWVTLDGNKHSLRAQDDLFQTVCKAWTGAEKPLECTPVEVEVFYSGINPQSRRFFLDHLIPAFRNLRERVHLQLIPYGVADPTSTIDEECAARPKTCEANRMQACALNLYFNDEVETDNLILYDGRNQTLQFIYCMFKNIENLDIAGLTEECGNQNVLLAEEVLACAREPIGQQYLAEMRTKTLGQHGDAMEHAPWIAINGVRSSLAESDLKTAICNAMEGDKPAYCTYATPAKVKIQFHYSSIDAATQRYIVNELKPHYRLLEEIIDLDPIPFGQTEILTQDDGNYTLICPNGEQECLGNLAHACLYNMYVHTDEDPVSDNTAETEYDGKLQFIQFLNCYFTHPLYPSKNVDAADSCATTVFGDVWSNVHMCMTSSVGVTLLREMEAKTAELLPALAYLPWMTVNNRHSYAVEHHIQRTVCDAFTGTEKPLDCYQIYDQDEKPVTEVHYEPGDVASGVFLTAHLGSAAVRNLATLNLVPFGRSTYTDTTKNCVNNAACDQYLEHACLISLYYASNPNETLDAIACTFGEHIAEPDVVNLCVNLHLAGTVTDPWEDIHACFADGTGDALLKGHAAAVAGLAPKLSHVPWILINGEHNLEAEESLTNEVCGVFYPADKPAECQPALLPVSIYYETQNTAVNSLLLNHLVQYREYLDEIGDFTFVPYGATSVSNGVYSCPQGDAQCEGNRVHACIINQLYNRTSGISEETYYRNRIHFAGFLICTAYREEAGETNPANIANECLDENYAGDHWSSIHACFATQTGTDLYALMGAQTAALNPPLTSAPVVTFGEYQSAVASRNFFQALCNSYGTVRAPLCSTLPSMAVKVGIYISGNAAGQSYLINQVLPFYREIVPTLRRQTSEARLHSIITPEVIAWGSTQYDAAATGNPFTCATANECYINRLFSCADHYHGDESKSVLHLMEFKLCFFQQTDPFNNPTDAANICANRVWVLDPFPQLEECATEDTQEAYDIFLKAKSKTENNYPTFTSFPAVTIDNQRSEAAETNLMQVACVGYKGYDYPTECDDYVVTEAPPTTAPPITTTPAPTTVPGQTTTQAPTTVPGQTTTQAPTTVPGQTTTQAPTTVPGQTTTQAPTTVPGQTTTQSPTTQPPGGGASTTTLSTLVVALCLCLSRWLLV